MTVAILTDSSAGLPPRMPEESIMAVVPLQLIFEDKVYRDGVDISATEFYELLKTTDKVPTTSAPSAGEFLEAYRDLAKKADSIACIIISSKLSASFDAALQAKRLADKELPGVQIEVVDSHTVVGALGFIVREAALAAAAGGTLPEVTEAARRILPRVSLFGALETLHYLAKGGRIGKVASWAGTLLSIKPIISVPTSQGEVIPVERPRTKQRAVQRMIDIMKEQVGGKPVHVNVMHADVPKEAERLREQVSSQFQCAEIFTSELSPVIGTHCGPGLVGLVFYCDE